MDSTTRKRTLEQSNQIASASNLQSPTVKRKRKATSNTQQRAQTRDWPDYFKDVYKALNTVIAFCSSRKHLATTFPVIRSSVEALLRGPLDLNKVAELKTLLPDLIKFAYIPTSQHRINAASSSSSKGKGREASPGYSMYSAGGALEEDEHVLVLDFAELNKSKRNKANNSFSLPPSLSPAATKKLIERRNELFENAVNELLSATPPEDSPIELLQVAAKEHLPIEPKYKGSYMQYQDDFTVTSEVPDPRNRPSVKQALREITGKQSDNYDEEDINEYIGLHWYKGQIVYRQTSEAVPGTIGQLDKALSPTIAHALKMSRNITDLYTHQASAINAIGEARNIVVSTRTASGKSVIYQVPFLRFLEEDPTSTAIFVYPTKALAQDQRAAFEQLLQNCSGLEHIQVATYDGDTPQERRRWIRENSSVIFTNFDMLHASIIPHEDLWRRFLKNLKLVTVDELHYYSGLLGTHIAMILRRFRRVCAAVGNRRSAFISCSATINNPRKHARAIFGLDDIEVITDDGAPSGEKEFLVWDPALIDPLEPSLGYQSAMHEAITLMCYLMKRGIRAILYAMKLLRMRLSSEGRMDVLNRDRRKIENEAFSGNLLGIVATTALELGVDIGVLDAVIMLGFPKGGLASFPQRQQAGRAGRRARDSLAVLVADQSPVDRQYVNNPKALFDSPTADLVVDLDSKIILEVHLQCAGHEMPLSMDDEVYFGPQFREVCETYLVKDKDGWYHTHPRYLPYPAKNVSIRGVEEERYIVVDITNLFSAGGSPKVLEEVEVSRAIFEIYEGAVFIHQGLTFLVKELSHDSKMARLVRTDVSWITKPSNIDAKQTYRIREIKDALQKAFYGRVEVHTTVFGYFKIRGSTILDVIDLETLPFIRETTGTWIDVPKGIIRRMRTKGFNPAEGIHAAQHAILNRFSMAEDLRTECKVSQKEYAIHPTSRKRPARLIFYDKSGEGVGVSAKAFDIVSKLVHEAYDTIKKCLCDGGCIKCVDSPDCKENNLVSSKLGAQLILQGILGFETDWSSFPDVDLDETPETVVEAGPVHTVERVEVEAV
ncbi:DEAD/H helicase [Hysterangium stoloniferum]|nr:DEAD/H helicase [Hysterangium stoloniferum]